MSLKHLHVLVVRAGLQALPKGQTEAAQALDLGYWRTNQLILLPQALRAVIPALVNLGIGVPLSTPLVAVIGMTDFLSAVREAASHEQEWPRCYTTAYFFAGAVFFKMCFVASRYSLISGWSVGFEPLGTPDAIRALPAREAPEAH